MDKRVQVQFCRIKLDDSEYWSVVNGVLADDLSINHKSEDEVVFTVESTTVLQEFLRITALVLIPSVFLITTSIVFLVHHFYLASTFAALLTFACISGFTSRQRLSIKTSTGILTKTTVWYYCLCCTKEIDTREFESIIFYYAIRGSKITATLRIVGKGSSHKLAILASFNGLEKIAKLCGDLSALLKLKNSGGKKAVFWM